MPERLSSNLFALLPERCAQELVDVLVDHSPIRIERIVSTGQASPTGFWYDQSQHEWVVLLQGEAELLLDGEQQPIRLRPGDYLLIPAHQKHRVQWTTPDQPTVWLAVFFG